MSDHDTFTAPRDRTRQHFIQQIRSFSQDTWAAGWYDGVDKIVREAGGHWIGLAIASGGWPTGYGAEQTWEPVTDAEVNEYESLIGSGLQYAIQIKWPDGDWLFVTQDGPRGTRIPEVYHSLAEAQTAASIWQDGSTRILVQEVTQWTPLT